ncbi:hypothetical protein ALP80_200024 [Pseudomonas savastanoi pv. fraxini]|nr:hypothetical protein ALP80_200024 [Pseudomonas savastanoi pv. fraxini]
MTCTDATMANKLVIIEHIDAAERYEWLRNHHVRIQGSEVWYAGAALDVRIDVGREHVARQAKDITEKKPVSRKRRLN